MATPIEEVVHQLPGQIPEGCSVIEEGQAKVLKRGNEVFYNPVQEFNRDLSIMSIKLFIQMLREEEVQKAEKKKLKDPNAVVLHRPIRVLEALSATGLRSIRYFKEIPGLASITANDIDPNAVKTIERNILFNGLNTQQITPNCGDASMVMYQAKDPKQRYTIVDLDPYGSPADFLDSAVQSVEDGGLLAVTCTDLGVLCGNHGETCFAKYGTMPIKGARYCHEQALRIALANIQQHASRHKRYIVPLISIYVDFYVRMFVRVYTSPQEVKHAGAKVSHVYQCTQCDSYHLTPLAKITGDEGHLKFAPGSGPPVNMTCAECNSVFKIGGPVWSEPMHSTDFLSRALQHLATDESKQMYQTHKRIFGLLSVASEELPDVPFFYVVSSLANTLRLSCPPIMPLRSALVNAGYRVSLSHCEPNSLKTNAPPSFIWDMMRAWNMKQEQQVNLDKLSDTSPAKLILSKAPTATVDFTPNKEAESKSQNLPRYLPNPTKDWGPGVRAGGKRDFDTMSMQEIIDKRRTASQEKQNKKRKLMEQGVCIKFQKGFCKNGDKCKYKHTLGAEATVGTNNNNAEDNTAVAAPDAMVE
jgi:tRNA (guanine26-N2/guanine27-N2)-dimethyltransferase